MAELVAQDMESRKHKYYPAILNSNNVVVAPTDIDRGIALKIMQFNSNTVGIFAVSANYARGLCSSLGGLRGPENHGAGEGYWYHYHGNLCPRAHCWYIG